MSGLLLHRVSEEMRGASGVGADVGSVCDQNYRIPRRTGREAVYSTHSPYSLPDQKGKEN